jgi:hypothetical protein
LSQGRVGHLRRQLVVAALELVQLSFELLHCGAADSFRR